MTVKIKKNVPLSPLTTFKIGGPAKYFTEVRTEDEVREVISWAKENQVIFIILAGGSNVLIPDEGVNGLVIHLVGDDFSCAGSVLDCNAGYDLLHLITIMADKGLGGWEKLAGIPGTVGGGVRGGIGAFGSEIKDFIVKVRALDSTTGAVREFSNSECDFSYRASFFKTHQEWVITRAYITLHRVNSAESNRIIRETMAEREKRHLQSARTAGSFFMNPTASEDICEMFETEKGVASRENRVPAGWLIERTGMKGTAVGGAQVSMQHSNYILNTGNATADDIRSLTERVKSAVKEKFGVDLQEEVRVIPSYL